MSTLLLSYPGPDFHPQGTDSGPGTARAALTEWLALCDHITRAGGRILVIDPAPHAPGQSAPVYAGRLGAVFNSPGKLTRPTFLRARGEAAPAPASEDPVCLALREAGLDTAIATTPWQGQVDLIPLQRNRFLLCHGGTSPSSPRAAAELRNYLPMGAQVLEVELAPGIPSGDRAVQLILTSGGAAALLVDRAALRSHTPEQLGRFAGGHVEVLGLNGEDVAAHAAECLVVRGTAILTPGSSTILRGQLARRGFLIVEHDLSHLLGPRGGGPRALALDLPGLVLAEDSPSYANRREPIFRLLDTYAKA